MRTGEMGFLWITGILNSRYPEDERYQMASHVVRLLGKHLDSGVTGPISVVKPTWVAPLVGFLSLCEKYHTTDSPPHPGSIALRILSTGPGPTHFDATILPVLTSTLLPTHPLQLRGLALKVFHTFVSGWFSSTMETVSDENLGEFLQAVGDPFQFTPDLPLKDGNPTSTADYEPMMAAAVLIEFSSSDLWQNHLHPPNFTSCEKIISTEEGRRAALKHMSYTAAHRYPEFLHTPPKVIAALKCLRELQCPNTAEVVVVWAQAAGVGTPTDHETWRSIR